MTDIRDIDRAAAAAIARHERLLHAKTLELLLGSMVARSGVREVRCLPRDAEGALGLGSAVLVTASKTS